MTQAQTRLRGPSLHGGVTHRRATLWTWQRINTRALLAEVVRTRAVRLGQPSSTDVLLAFAKLGDADVLGAQLALCADAAARAVAACAMDARKRSPLHYAARNGHTACVLVLLGAGALPHTPDEEGNTALHLAAHRRDARAVEALVDAWPAGMPPNPRNCAGKTPADLVTDEPRVLALLRDKAAAHARASLMHGPPGGAGAVAVPTDLAAWMAALDLSQHAARLVTEHKVRAVEELAILDADDLKQSGLSKIEVHRFMVAAAKLNTDTRVPMPVSPSNLAGAPSGSLSSTASSSGSWDFFLSHFQRNGGPQMAHLRAELQLAGKRAWFDKNETPTLAGMKHGVANSAVFLLFLMREVFTRTYCLLEIREALALGKPFILLRETADAPVYVADDGETKRTSARIDELQAEAPFELKKLFVHLVAIEHRHEKHEREAMIRKLCAADTPTVVP